MEDLTKSYHIKGGVSMPSNYGKKDAAKDTNSSVREVSEAWHAARDDSGVRDSGGSSDSSRGSSSSNDSN